MSTSSLTLKDYMESKDRVQIHPVPQQRDRQGKKEGTRSKDFVLNSGQMRDIREYDLCLGQAISIINRYL